MKKKEETEQSWEDALDIYRGNNTARGIDRVCCFGLGMEICDWSSEAWTLFSRAVRGRNLGF